MRPKGACAEAGADGDERVNLIADRAGRRTSRWRLLAGSAVALFVAQPALAQTPAAGETASEQGQFSAQKAERDARGVLTATGDVEVRYLDRTLRADGLVYDPESGTFTAEGDIVIVNTDGGAIFADKVMLDDEMRAGVATGFSAVLPGDPAFAEDNNVPVVEARFAAANAILHSETLRELNLAIFTACPICTESEDPLSPTWSLSAERIVQDSERQVVVYRNAVIRVKNVPVFWTPYFAHADPQAERASGLLPPRISQTRRRGLSYEQPLLWVISPSEDLVVSPQINTEVNPFINGTWRRRFYSGDIEARVGYTNERDFNTGGMKFGPDRDKAYVLARGLFEPSPEWTLGFAAERVNDKLLFDQYSIQDIYQSRGLFLSDDRLLTSQVYAVRQDERSYLSVSALAFQSLRALPISACAAPPFLGTLACSFGVRPIEDDDGLPFVAPLIEGRYEPEGDVFGGRLRARGSAAALIRNEAPGAPNLPGVDSRRATVEIDWRNFMTFDNGVRVEPFVLARGDHYNVGDLVPGEATTTRGLATVGLDFSWPFIKRTSEVTWIVEPIAQIALSPDSHPYALIPNEDSIAFDFNDTNLFEANKSPGFDLWEGGQRLNVGLRVTADWGEGRNAQMVVGRSFRAEVDPVFAARTGLRSRASDWIFAAEATPITGLSFYTKARLDAEDLKIQRAEIGADVDLDRTHGYLRYLKEKEDFSGKPREDVETWGDVMITGHWGVSFGAVRDLENEVWRRVAGGIVYLDDCTRFEIVYQREENPVLGGRASDSLAVRLTLATLGGTGYRDQRKPRPGGL